MVFQITIIDYLPLKLVDEIISQTVCRGIIRRGGRNVEWIKLKPTKRSRKWSGSHPITNRLSVWMRWGVEVCAVNTEQSRGEEGRQHWILNVNLYCKWGRRFRIHVFRNGGDRKAFLPPHVVTGRGLVSVSASTWALLCRAGDDPLDETALHQRFTSEPRLLPLGALCLSARVGILSVGVGHQAAVKHLLVVLREITEKKPT